MDEWLRPYDIPPAEQQEVEALDMFLVTTLERFIRVRLPGETAIRVGSKGSTARATQSSTGIDFDLAVVGVDPERHEVALNAALNDLRNEIVRDIRFRDLALRVFGMVPELIVAPFCRRPDFDLWLGRLMADVGERRSEFVDIAIEQNESIGLWYTSWIRKEKMAGMSPDARRRARASIRLFKDVMQRIGAYSLKTGGVRGIVAELMILQLGGDFTTAMEKLYSHTIIDAGDGEQFEIIPQEKVASEWLVENPHPKRAAPHPSHNLLMLLDHDKLHRRLQTNGWNWRVLATLAWRTHWLQQWNEPLEVERLVRDVQMRVGPRPQLTDDTH